jgi:hypothetical protein
MSEEYYPEFFVKYSVGRRSLVHQALVFFILLVLLGGGAGTAYGSQTGVLEGKIIDIAEKPVQGAEVYIFDSPDVKRPADFISNRTTEDGRYRVQLPSGNYWAVAIFRQGGERFGPLGSSDKHSGDPVALEIAAGGSRSMDFTVMNLREAAMKHRKRSDELIKVTGRVVNKSRAPVQMAYAMAHKMQQFGNLPDYISAWTDEQGGYTLYLPPGRYFLGALVGFPPKHDYNLYLDQQFTGDTADLDIVVDKEEGEGKK